ncbi:MAG: universal stress protein [Pseudoxanthomonas suwonensis]|nr:universal stress protein [Pseudoxanthomonas suwonensis]
MYAHLLIATDGSELAGKAVEHGLELARRTGARVTVLTVSEPVVLGTDDAFNLGVLGNLDSELQAARERAAQELFAPLSERASAAGVPLETRHVVDRHAADAIVEEAEKSGCDLVVMASHGRRGLRRLLLGSQTSEVLGRSQVPVLVIR